MATRPLAMPLIVEGINSNALITEEVLLSFKFETPSGPLVLSNVKCWIAPRSIPKSAGQVPLGREIMSRLGYSPQQMLRNAV